MAAASSSSGSNGSNTFATPIASSAEVSGMPQRAQVSESTTPLAQTLSGWSRRRRGAASISDGPREGHLRSLVFNRSPAG